MGTRSGAHSSAVTASLARVAEEKTGPTCRLNKDDNALVTISLGKDDQKGAKVSERTTQHYFDQNAPLNGDTAVDISGFHSRSTTSEATWVSQQLLALAQSTSGDSLLRSSRHFNGINQQHANHHQYHLQRQHANHHQHQHQQQPQQQALLKSSRGGRHDNKMGEQRSPPLQPLFVNRTPTVRMDREIGRAHV